MQWQNRSNINISQKPPHFLDNILFNTDISSPKRHHNSQIVALCTQFKTYVRKRIYDCLFIILSTQQIINFINVYVNYYRLLRFFLGICYARNFKTGREHFRCCIRHLETLIWRLPLSKSRNCFRKNPVRHLRFAQIV